MTNDQRCGLCRHWKQFKTVQQTGMCEFPVPSSVTRKDEFMDASDGADCPCFERKEASDAESPILHLPAAPQMTDAEMIRTEAWQSITDELAHAAYLRGIEEGKRQAAAPQQAEPVAWMKPTRDSCYLRPAETMLAIHEDCDGIVRTGWKPLYLHPPANEVQRLREALAAVLDKLAKEQNA